jgi:hypothetical protein
MTKTHFLGHKGNANQNHMKISSQFCGMAVIKKTNKKCWKGYVVNNIEINHICVGTRYNKTC